MAEEVDSHLFQDCVLFNDTIEYNIGYGAKNHDATLQEIMEAARKAALHDFVMTQPQGYQTKVGERGLRLSGGEKQRVAIARAVLKQPKLMIFDEATSSLDSITEAEILKQLNEIATNHTSLTIAHRLSTVMNSDLILVLDKGRLVEQGTHIELLAKNGSYKFLWDRQERAENLKNELAQCAADGNESDGESEEEPIREKKHRCGGGAGRDFLKLKWTSSDTSASTNQTNSPTIDLNESQTSIGDESENLLQESNKQENLHLIIDMEQSEDETKSPKNNSTASRRL
jgi:ABC-type multidrug transport system ATPase subunit